MEPILVLGAGYLGGRLAAALIDQGHDVIAVRRTPAPPPFLSVDLRQLDAALHALGVTRVDAIAVTLAPSRGAGYEIYAEATGKAVALARDFAASFVLYTSSTGVYAERDGGLVDETSPLATDTDRGRLLVAAEARLANSPCPVAVLRLSGLYGPGRNPIERYRANGSTAYTNRIHVDDAVATASLVLSRREPLLVNVTDDEPARAVDIARWLAAREGAPPPEERPGEAGMPNRRISNARLRSLGITLRYPTFRDGLEALSS